MAMRWFTRYILCLAAFAAFLVAGCARSEAAPVSVGPPPKEVATEDLIAYALASADGKEIGPVHGIVMRVETGTVHYVVVVLPDKYHFGKGAYGPPDDDYLLIPWSHLKLDAANHLLMADVDAAILNESPLLDDLPDPSLPNWDAPLRQFWAGV